MTDSPKRSQPPGGPDDFDPLMGHTLDGRYRIERVLGEGSTGLVYAARHVILNKPLAIRVLRHGLSKDSWAMQRFQQEAQTASAIGNQHIIDILDFGALPNGSTYFVMEFLDGLSLSRAIEVQHPMPADRVIHIAKQLCEALGAAHERSIVHCDLKPDNVFLMKRTSEVDFVKVLDFGMAKAGGTIAKGREVFGTPHYMSPEACMGANVDERTDVYALGVILYEMASGCVPFDADNLMGILTRHLYEKPLALREYPPPVQVPAALEAIIMKCLEKSANDRYQSMAELKADLEAAGGDAASLPSETRPRTDVGVRSLIGTGVGESTSHGPSPVTLRERPFSRTELAHIRTAAVRHTNRLAFEQLIAGTRAALDAEDAGLVDAPSQRVRACRSLLDSIEITLKTRLASGRERLLPFAREPTFLESIVQGARTDAFFRRRFRSFLANEAAVSIEVVATWLVPGELPVDAEFELHALLGVADLVEDLLVAGALRNKLAHLSDYQIVPTSSLERATPCFQSTIRSDGNRSLIVRAVAVTWLEWLTRSVLERKRNPDRPPLEDMAPE